MARWWTSDLHFGHANIVRFSDRPFSYDLYDNGALAHAADVPHMNEAIVESINAHVGFDDELWILGDLAMGQLDDTLKISRRFVCQNITLVAGNHDRCHPYNGAKAEGWVRRYTEDTGIRTLILTETNVTIGGTVVTVNHFPYGGDSHEMHVREDGKGFVDKFAAWRPEDTGGWLLHGHVHEKWRQRGRQINLGIDAWGGVPVHDDTIRAMMDAGPQDLPRFMWERKMKEEVSL